MKATENTAISPVPPHATLGHTVSEWKGRQHLHHLNHPHLTYILTSPLLAKQVS